MTTVPTRDQQRTGLAREEIPGSGIMASPGFLQEYIQLVNYFQICNDIDAPRSAGRSGLPIRSYTRKIVIIEVQSGIDTGPKQKK